jgi:hypothetical protein
MVRCRDPSVCATRRHERLVAATNRVVRCKIDTCEYFGSAALASSIETALAANRPAATPSAAITDLATMTKAPSDYWR